MHSGLPVCAFDDRSALNASLDDLSPALLHAHLVTSGSRVARESLDVPTLCRRMNLSRKPNGHEVPRNVALLFFADEPSRWFPSARIELSHFPTGRTGAILRQTFEGPLPAQLRSAMEVLRGHIVERTDKHPARAQATVTASWPFAAIEEALTNAIHHRGYDSSEPIKVELLPDELRITSYPGPVDGITHESIARLDFPAVPARNRRIAELLRDVRLAEAARTGVALIRDSMRENGSPAPTFHFDDARTFFEVRLPIHPAFKPRAAIVGQPIRVNRPAPPEEVVGREELVSMLVRTLERQSVALCGPRGRGVSSVLGALAAAAPQGTRVLSLDLAGVTERGFEAAVWSWLDPDHAAESSGRFATLRDALDTVPGPRLWVVVDHLGDVDDADALYGVADSLLAWSASDKLRIAVALTTPDQLPDPQRDQWERAFRLVPVPPLGPGPARELAGRVLAGAGISDPAPANTLADLSAGLPAIVQQLAHAVALDPSRSLEEHFDELLVTRGDPMGLAARIRGLRTPPGRGRYRSVFNSAERAVLDSVAPDPAGRAHLDVVALATGRGVPRLEVSQAIRDLELHGWVVRVDGRLRLEHPLVAAEWVRQIESEPPASPADDDIPF